MASFRKSNSRSRRIGQRLQKGGVKLLKLSVKNTHTRILTCGILIGLWFLPTWSHVMWQATLSGAATPFLNLAFAGLGLHSLWQDRQHLAKLTATDEERLVGYLLILGSVAAFPFCLNSVSLQSFICISIVLGIVYSTWGLPVLRHNGLAIFFVLISLYPDWVFLSNWLWRVVTPPNLLENLMAWMGSLGLQAIGQPAKAEGVYLTLPQGAVEVASGCSGFDMAFVMVCFSILLGLFMQQSWLKITGVAAIGTLLALVFNIPRIMLLAIASIYWGQSSFDFWHGPIGGQVFSTTLLTIYYYIAMYFFNSPTSTQKMGR